MKGVSVLRIETYLRLRQGVATTLADHRPAGLTVADVAELAGLSRKVTREVLRGLWGARLAHNRPGPGGITTWHSGPASDTEGVPGWKS